ncbi:OmpA family protein [Treponema primitia ZAS-2]|uniref:OmpA family protein n=1 Tax=Treponema primitia (strain ATCC BAA-887 / DSM 12427 / ZAS-2) TaxID=545694 RepID=F5YNQ1_TREPZ|nr:FlgD immunoglobulin-like domain containing protein [Treponema primitia]AEF85932.1 OmpA family protein [Treponema primitia ZAS-2]
MSKRTLFCLVIALTVLPGLWADPVGAETSLDLSSPELAGRGGFVTSQGGAPASILNPAAGGDAQRIVFDAGYMALVTTSTGGGFGNAINLGTLFPTKYAVFGGNLNFLQSPGFSGSYPIGTTFGGNFTAAKELYPGLNVGLGFNFAFGEDDDDDGVWTAAGDLGIRHNVGKIGPLQNFTYAFVFRDLGHSYMPGAFTPGLGIIFDFVHIQGREDKPDPLVAKFATDFTFPTFQNMTGKFGVSATIAELVTLSGSMGFNIKDIADHQSPSWLPSIGLTVNLGLLSTGKRIAGGRLPSDGDVGVSMGFKPLYKDVIAIGPGVSWSVGVLDKKPPVIVIDYPETRWISPNNDGKSDTLEFPVTITDQRYVAEWKLEIFDESGNLVRTYKNKELRVETQGFKNIMNRLIAGKSGIEVPPTFRWDGIFDSGDIAGDGTYTFVISAADDNGNAASSPRYTVMVDNTPPEIEIAEITDANKIFSPDGDGNKDTLTIDQSGSREETWEAGIYDASGNKVKNFNISDGKPEPITWDGTGDDGHIVADGVYSYRISATDKGENSESASLENIIVSTIQPKVSLTLNDAFFSPNGDGIKDTLILSAAVPVKEGILGWTLNIQDNSGRTQRTITGETQAPNQVIFDGRGDTGGILSEGTYNAELSINYRNGYVSKALSPVFTLDTTAPRASIRTEYNAFSPNNDGIQDEMILNQEGSAELTWVGEVRRAGAAPTERPVRTLRFTGVPVGRITWDGLTDAGALAQDGNYSYQLFSTDPAGNTGASNTVNFSLSTADTPVLLSTDLRAFSPNNDRNKDTINIIPQLQVTQGISSWRLDISNSDGVTVQSFNGQNTVPASVSWNGRDSAGNTVPDGNYTAHIEVRYAAGNQPVAISRPFAVDTVAPKAQLSSPYTLFSPNGDGKKDNLPINVTTEGDDDTWEAVITDSKGTVIQSWTWTGKAPSSLSWDGTDSAGNAVPDGTYRFNLSSTDEAGNDTRIPLDNIIVDARIPRAFLTSSSNAVAPKAGPTGEALRFSVILTPRDGIENWSLELKDESGTVRRHFPAPGTAQTAAPPELIIWNGYDDSGILREGRFTPQLSITYAKGDVVSISAPPITVDVTGPALSFAYEPEYFSPDNDGVDDELAMFLGAMDLSPIANWSLEIHEPEPPNLLFYRIEGRGSPAERTLWDGRSSKGELVQSATDYPFIFRAIDSLGNISTLDGTIGVDVLVIRDGDNLKIMVPSIVFRANEADFKGKDLDPVQGLTQAQIDNNNRVLRRIAQILNKFRDYRVQVEGHANPTSKVVPPAEAQGDLALSERRSKAVVDFLVGFGVNRGRLSAIGRGSTRPIITFEDHDNWWKNRRVEFILIK